ncbi:MAG: metal ABC transporter permease [Planctomycetes bacterium]|nr:metal ABC transporter permease [Planctomycetota bacterium]
MEGVPWGERILLFRWALLAALVASAICPLVGSFLLLRRTSFYGITLPLFATLGVVLGFTLLPWWIGHVGLGGLSVEAALSDSHAAMNYHFAWAAALTFAGLGALVALGRRGGTETGRVAAAFAIANASTILLGRLSPLGKGFVDELLQGEILGVGVHEFEMLAVLLGVVLVLFVVFHRELLLVSFDREAALVLGVRATALEALLHGITGLCVAAGTMIVGPTLLFGLLVLPPLAARRWARSMTSFLVLSGAFGLLSALGGILAAFQWDLPLGAAIVGTAALLLVPGLLRPGAGA